MLTLALALVVLPLMGTAIDGTICYLVRVKLSQSVDAAALGGARSLSTGLTLTAQSSSATATALSYLNANFPAGFMGTSFSGSPVISISQSSTMFRTVQVQATVVVPLTFLRVAGFRSATISQTAQSTRRDVNLIMVVDRSNSMALAGVCGTMIANAQAFVNNFADGRDILGLITFTDGASLDYAPTASFKSGTPSLTSVLGTLQCGGDTSSAEGLWDGYQQILAVNQPGRLNVIVFFTDGRPNGVVATYPVKSATDTRYTWQNPNSQTTSAPSLCPRGTILNGEIAQLALDASTGYTGGVLSPVNSGITDTSLTSISAPGCTFTGRAGLTAMSSDVAYIPTLDAYGNATTGYKTSIVFPTGSPYAGQIRPDTPPSITAASTNAADNAAARIRADTTFNPVIYSLGLGGTVAEPLDQDFLRRIANDPQSSCYDSTRPTGHFYYASDITQLSAAYQAIASQILRLSQ
jgi:Mg-chelatase subunit ChlD